MTAGRHACQIYMSARFKQAGKQASRQAGRQAGRQTCRRDASRLACVPTRHVGEMLTVHAASKAHDEEQPHHLGQLQHTWQYKTVLIYTQQYFNIYQYMVVKKQYTQPLVVNSPTTLGSSEHTSGTKRARSAGLVCRSVG